MSITKEDAALLGRIAGPQHWTEDDARRVLSLREATGESEAGFARRRFEKRTAGEAAGDSQQGADAVLGKGFAELVMRDDAKPTAATVHIDDVVVELASVDRAGAEIVASLTDEGALDEELKKRVVKPKAPPAPRKGRDLPGSLPRVDNLLPVPEHERDCHDCHVSMVELAPEVTEVVDYEPGSVFVRRDINEVLACRANDCGVVRGPLGDKVIPGGI